VSLLLPLTAAGQAPREFVRHHNRLSLVAFAPTNGQLLFSNGFLGGTLALSVPDTGEVRRFFGGLGDEYTAAAFSPDGKLLAAAASREGVVRVWAVGGRLLHTLQGHQGAVWALAFSADSKTLATGGEDGTARLWEMTTGKERARLRGHHGSVFAVAFAPDGNTLATGGIDGRALLWQLSALAQTAGAP
jgi:WD40 repeat protein